MGEGRRSMRVRMVLSVERRCLGKSAVRTREAWIKPRRLRYHTPRNQRKIPKKAGLKDTIIVRCPPARGDSRNGEVEEAEDVIDLSAPRRVKRAPAENISGICCGSVRVKSTYTPNPRLYPGPQGKPKPKPKPKSKPRSNHVEGQGRRRKRRFSKPVPNARLYRPAPPKPLPPPARPNTSWPPPPPLRPLDTASRVAFRLSEQRRVARERQPVQRPRSALSPRRHPSPSLSPTQSPPALQSKRLVVTLPTAAGQKNIEEQTCYTEETPERYRPTSAHFRLRSLDTDSGASTPVANRFRFEVPPPQVQVQRIMEAANRHSTSPEDCSDGNEPTSAPSEFLAEFLSAIMRRQYAEALKYCRLILQYEPNNTTARGFYPLLRQKLETQKKSTEVAEAERGSSSEESHNDASVGKKVERRRLSEKRVAVATKQPQEESMQQEADDSPSEECVQSRSRTHSEGSCASQSSLELDSSDAVAHSSPSISFSRRTGQTDSASGSGAWCVSAGSAGSGSRSDPDDNGNQTTTFTYQPGDVENDNAAASGEPHPGARLKKDTSSLQRLRAQFACSIK